MAARRARMAVGERAAVAGAVAFEGRSATLAEAARSTVCAKVNIILESRTSRSEQEDKEQRREWSAKLREKGAGRPTWHV